MSGLTRERRIYNCSGARRIVECGCCLISKKFRLFEVATRLQPVQTNQKNIVLACCVLRNVIRTKELSEVYDEVMNIDEECVAATKGAY